MVSLLIQESAMPCELEQAEQRALRRCPVYDKNNMHWKEADNIAKQLSELVKSIGKKNESLFSNDMTEADTDDQMEKTEESLLNQSLLLRKKKEKMKK